ncbi:O-antigen ligase family protein [Patescibacteria group bacterium]|nr:O-antigen ligase family protein [Patescibacteria group bacterium]
MKLHQKIFWLLIFLLPVQLGRHFWPNFSFVLGLKIDYLSPTVYLTDLLVLVILALWAWEYRYKLLSHLLAGWLKRNWWIIAVFVYLLINAFLALNQGAAFYKLIKIIEFTLVGYYIAQNRYSLSNLHLPLLIAVIYSSLMALVQFFKQSSLSGIFWWLGERTFDLTTPGIAKAIINGHLLLRSYATFSHPNALAGFLLVALILTAPFLKRAKLWSLAYGFLASLAIIFSFSRSVWLVGLLFLVVFGIKKIKELKIYSLRMRTLIFSLSSLFFVLCFWLLVISSHFSTDEAFFQRAQLMKSSFLMIKDFPLSGVGLNNFIVHLPNYWSLTGFTYWLQPVHNLYLLLIAEIGWLGFLIFLWFLVLSYRKILLKKNNHGLLLGALSAILLLGFFDHYWLTLQQNQLLLTILLGLAWSSQS